MPPPPPLYLALQRKGGPQEIAMKIGQIAFFFSVLKKGGGGRKKELGQDGFLPSLMAQVFSSLAGGGARPRRRGVGGGGGVGWGGGGWGGVG